VTIRPVAGAVTGGIDAQRGPQRCLDQAASPEARQPAEILAPRTASTARRVRGVKPSSAYSARPGRPFRCDLGSRSDPPKLGRSFRCAWNQRSAEALTNVSLTASRCARLWTAYAPGAPLEGGASQPPDLTEYDRSSRELDARMASFQGRQARSPSSPSNQPQRDGEDRARGQ
jgi:hypothetical protein